MYETSTARELELSRLGADSEGIHLSCSTHRFFICRGQIAVEKRFHKVHFESVNFLQVQLEQSHFMGVEFSGCSFADVVFRSCVFVDCKFEDAIFSNTHFQNCFFLSLKISQGPIDAGLHIRSCTFYPVSPPLPKSTVVRENLVWGAGSSEARSTVVQSLPLVPVEQGVVAPAPLASPKKVLISRFSDLEPTDQKTS